MKKIKSLKELNLLDRFLFAEAVEDTEFLEIVLSIILDEEITLKEAPQSEKEKRTGLTKKQIRLDVMAIDDEDKVYDAEVQKQDTHNLPRRFRYYHCLIARNLLESGETDYNKLNDVVVIMIAPFDLFKKGLYKYTFRMQCVECPGVELADGATTIFLNTKGTDPEGVSEELIAMLRYFENTTSEVADSSHSQRIKVLQQKVNSIRGSEERGVKYMLEWEEKEFARQEGLEEGQRATRFEIAGKMIERGEDPRFIAEITGLSEEEVAHLSKETT